MGRGVDAGARRGGQLGGDEMGKGEGDVLGAIVLASSGLMNRLVLERRLFLRGRMDTLRQEVRRSSIRVCRGGMMGVFPSEYFWADCSAEMPNDRLTYEQHFIFSGALDLHCSETRT